LLNVALGENGVEHTLRKTTSTNSTNFQHGTQTESSKGTNFYLEYGVIRHYTVFWNQQSPSSALWAENSN